MAEKGNSSSQSREREDRRIVERIFVNVQTFDILLCGWVRVG